MAKEIRGHDSHDIPEELFSRIQENPLFKVSQALSEYGFMDHRVVSRLESIDSLSREDAEAEYKNFLQEVEKLFESRGDDVDEIYL